MTEEIRRWPADWEAQMWKVQTSVNLMPYVPDAEKYKTSDFWAEIGIEGGDCEDYALAKSRGLLERGWPIEYLHLACCYVETGEYHAVLIVETPQGDFMLDNRADVPVSLDDLPALGYKPHVIQAVGGRPGWCEWVS